MLLRRGGGSGEGAGAAGKERGLCLSPGAAPAALHKAQFPAPSGGAGDACSMQIQPRRNLGSHFSAPDGGAALPAGSGPPHGARHCAHYITAPAPPPAAPLTCAAVTCPNSSLNRCPGKGDYSTGASFKGGSRRLALARTPPRHSAPARGRAPLGHRWGIALPRPAPPCSQPGPPLTQITLLARVGRAGDQPFLSSACSPRLSLPQSRDC